MSTSKRHRSHDDDADDQRTAQRLRFGEIEHSSDQNLDPRAIFSATFEEFRLVVKLKSMSKAARNDPKPSPLLTELFNAHGLEPTEDKVDDHETDGSGPSEASQTNSGHDLSSSDEQEKVMIDQTGTNAHQEGGGSQNQSTYTISTFSQHVTTVDTEADSILTEVPHDVGVPCSSSSSQDEDYEEGSDEDSIYDDAHNDDDDDDDRSEYQSLSEFDWIEEIEITMSSLVNYDEHGNPEIVGYCDAKLIRRDQIRHDFYAELEQPTEQTCWLAFDLFDRYGRLRSEFMIHPVIKGTGVWGQEIDYGDLLLIEVIYVERAQRRQQLGRKMVEALLQVTRRKTKSCTVFSFPSLLNLHDISQEFEKLKDDIARDETSARELGRATAFFRSLGFRRVGNSKWFATTTDCEHPSHKLALTDDIDPPKRGLSTLHSALQPFQQITDPPVPTTEQLFSQKPAEDPDYLGALQSCFSQEGLSTTYWMSTDQYGNNVLHLALKIMNTLCVEWIMKQEFGPQLLEIRNHRGETPMECLIFHLEKLRVQRSIKLFTASISDKFSGHSKDGVHCLVLLHGFPDLESFAKAKGFHALQQLIAGCTCGKCIEGFLSPRMSHALRVQAEMGHDMLHHYLVDSSGSAWIEENDAYLEFLPARLRDNLVTNKSLRTGFANLWKHIGSCLEHDLIPDERNVLGQLRNDHEWPPATRNFLERGGTVENAFLAVCHFAMAQDDWIGDGEYAETFSDDIADLPECRNDREFGFVSGACGYRPISLVRNVDMWGNTLDEYGNIIDSLR